jgi:hypothetical protein
MTIGDTTYPLPPTLTPKLLYLFLFVIFWWIIYHSRSRFGKDHIFDKLALFLTAMLVGIGVLIYIPMPIGGYSTLFLVMMSIPTVLVLLYLLWSLKTKNSHLNG